MKTLGVTYNTYNTNQTPAKNFEWEKRVLVQDPQNKKNTDSWNVHREKVHIFNVWTIIMQSLSIKEWTLLGLQITQTRQPLSFSDGEKNV